MGILRSISVTNLPIFLMVGSTLYRTFYQWQALQQLGKTIYIIPKVPKYESKGTGGLIFSSILLLIVIYGYVTAGVYSQTLLILTTLGMMESLFIRMYFSKLPQIVAEHGIIAHREVVRWKQVEDYWIQTFDSNELSILYLKIRRMGLLSRTIKVGLHPRNQAKVEETLHHLKVSHEYVK